MKPINQGEQMSKKRWRCSRSHEESDNPEENENPEEVDNPDEADKPMGAYVEKYDRKNQDEKY